MLIVEKSCKTLINKALQLRYFHLNWCCLQNTDMKIQNSSSVSPFGGLNYVLETFDKLGIDKFLISQFPRLAPQCKYTWKDILYSYWSVFFCGGDCAEDLAFNLKPTLSPHPKINMPSPDRVLERIKALSLPSRFFKTERGQTVHQFSINKYLNQINLKLLKKLALIHEKQNILDYDNTLIFTEKSDAKNTYQKKYGYCPGVGIIGKNIVYIENRNGNSNPETLQKQTLERMFDILEENDIHISAFRADGASYTLATIAEIDKRVEKFYIRGRVYDTFADILNEVKEWSKVEFHGKTVYRASILFTPFTKVAKRTKQEHLLKQYRLVITKEARDDGQINLFTGEAFNYRAILTNDFELSDNDVVFFYNQRGATEREFDVLKNDFGWNNMPFSKMEQNHVFLIITSMCRNLYNYIINSFSKLYRQLKPHFRIKKFIFRFICIPAKWFYSGREWKLRIYGQIAVKT